MYLINITSNLSQLNIILNKLSSIYADKGKVFGLSLTMIVSFQ